jgi:hypothetical protein
MVDVYISTQQLALSPRPEIIITYTGYKEARGKDFNLQNTTERKR